MSDRSRDTATDLVLVADIGGTNVRFALAAIGQAQRYDASTIRKYLAADFPTLADAARRYLEEIGRLPRRAVFGIAAPVTGNHIRLTNNPWRIDVAQTRDALGLSTLRVVNDFAAQTAALVALAPEHCRAIGPQPPPAIGASPKQNFCVVGPGTGLGVGALMVRGQHHIIVETEGGHGGFAPRNPREVVLLAKLQERYGRVSNERLVSGPGLAAIHAALIDTGPCAHPEPTPETIVTHYEARTDERCVQAVELFCALLGAVAGDLVLAYGAYDGVYIPGSLAMRLAPELERGNFRAQFEDKGRYRDTLAAVPTVAVRHPDAGLLGAAVIAQDEASDPAFAPGLVSRASTSRDA